MANEPRNLIVLSDGTGNSASKAFKTNVWRLYQAISLGEGTQVAVFGDGVGTSAVKVLRVIGLALGIGVKRNVLNLYKFLCRNYHAEDDDKDRIWAFGFSRGAFTIRVLVGLIHHEGLVTFKSEAELNRNAVAAYRAYRKEAFKTMIPWVLVGRVVRDWLIAGWNKLTGARTYREVKEHTQRLHRDKIDVHFVGVWDTVVAYGLPIDELTTAVDTWIWPMKFRDASLLPNVQHARHALSLDDERRTFHPVPWDEAAERAYVATESKKAGRLKQVWFAGMHADVGGGYPDDGLSFVPLCWMIKEAADKGLRFEEALVAEYHALAAPTGRMYDSRSGVGVFWRYQPRDAQLLLGKGITPVVHGSVMTRMTCGGDGYAPISLPETIAVQPGSGPAVAFNAAAVNAGVTEADAIPEPSEPADKRALHERRRVLDETRELVTLAAAQPKRTDIFTLVLDTVWWRRVVYFITLAFALTAGAFPLLAQYLRIEGVTDQLNDRAGGPVGWTLGLIKGFLPGVAASWLTAIVRNPAGAAVILIGLIASLGLSTFLERRIRDRSRAAWNVRPKLDGETLDRLAPTNQRRALAKAWLFLGASAIVAKLLKSEPWLVYLLAVASVVFGLWWAYRRYRPAKSVDPAHPNPFLRFARTVRMSKPAVKVYRFTAQKIVPFVFIFATGLLVLSMAHRATFDLLSTSGRYCTATAALKKEEMPPKAEILGSGLDFPTSAMCHATNLRLVAGGKYRIRLEMKEGLEGEWFDKGRHTGIAGFAADGPSFYVAAPLKRWWRENWFQPIVRIGEVGNYEHVLQPAAPLPDFRPADCPVAKSLREAAAWNRNVSSKADPEYKQARMNCDKNAVPQPSRVLVADITADATGELFLYVNDVVLLWPGRTGMFYLNNSGVATVTVTRILAPAVER